MGNLSEDVSQAQQSHCTREFTAAITDKVKPDKNPSMDGRGDWEVSPHARKYCNGWLIGKGESYFSSSWRQPIFQ